MRIGTKLILWYSGLLVVIIVLFSVGVFSIMERTMFDSIDATLDETVVQVIQNSRVQRVGEFGGPDGLAVRLPQLDVFRASGVGVQVWALSEDAELELVAASVNIDYDEPLDADALGTEDPQYSNRTLGGQQVRVLTRPMFTLGGQLLGNVQAVALLAPVIETRERLVLVMIFSALTAIGGSIALGMWLSRQALRPIDRITHAAAKIARTDDLSTRLPLNGPMDELGHLTMVFNEMMDRLQDLFSVQQRFVADVSHELRTPLTAIRGNLDLMKRYGVDEMSLEAVESEVGRMSRMVNDLLLLARADYGGMTLELDPLDADAVVAEAVRQAKVIAKDRDLVVQLESIEPVRVMGNGDRLMQLLLNLLSNAIKFTPDRGRISAAIRRDATHAIITVSDTGIGISDADQKHVFDRFYQADASRKRSSEEESSGLGLSIAKWIVDAHHGTISVSSKLNEGTTFTVRIPVLESPGQPHDESGHSDTTPRRRDRLLALNRHRS
jgi:signal transduction histidine kinase